MCSSRCSTLLWNGPLGAFEVAPFRLGTFQLARAALRHPGAASSPPSPAAAIPSRPSTPPVLPSKFTYVSTAGGAFLEWLEGRDLPGVAALIRAAPGQP